MVPLGLLIVYKTDLKKKNIFFLETIVFQIKKNVANDPDFADN